MTSHETQRTSSFIMQRHGHLQIPSLRVATGTETGEREQKGRETQRGREPKGDKETKGEREPEGKGKQGTRETKGGGETTDGGRYRGRETGNKS